jgi:hypothetical protein
MGSGSMHKQEVPRALAVDRVANYCAVNFNTLIKNEHA